MPKFDDVVQVGNIFIDPDGVLDIRKPDGHADLQLAGGEAVASMIVGADGSQQVIARTVQGKASISVGHGWSEKITDNGGIYTTGIHVGNDENIGWVHVYNRQGQRTLSIEGSSGTIQLAGDIQLMNGDIAEEFDQDGHGELTAGSLVALSGQDQVSMTTSGCHSAVIGIVAGAGNYKPGIVLDQRTSKLSRPRVAVSIMGKAECVAISHDLGIRPGDFLVSSDSPGTATRAPDHPLPRGVIFGRSLGFLAPKSRGMLPVLLSPGIS